MDLSGRIGLVTGGARRVGRAFSLALARAGADVMVNYAHSKAEAQATVAEIEAMGRRAIAVRADVSDAAHIRELVDRAADFGGLDVLVNSASLFESKPVLEITEADWDRVMGVNLKGPFLLSQAAAPLLRARGGVIVNIADLSGLRVWPAYAHHGVAKAGLIHLTKTLARALAPEIRVNCIVPGTVLPPEEYNAEEIRRERDRTALGRLGSPEDVARALLFLVESDFVTGEVLVVDGGSRLR